MLNFGITHMYYVRRGYTNLNIAIYGNSSKDVELFMGSVGTCYIDLLPPLTTNH